MAQYILVCGLRFYRWVISPVKTVLFGPLARCRFTPSCSEYALESIRLHGALAGSWLALGRIARCHPWGGCGWDPVPAAQTERGPTGRAGKSDRSDGSDASDGSATEYPSALARSGPAPPRGRGLP